MLLLKSTGQVSIPSAPDRSCPPRWRQQGLHQPHLLLGGPGHFQRQKREEEKQRLPEKTGTGTGSQHSLFINLQITDSKDIISAMHPKKGPKHTTPMSAQ